MIKRFWTSLRNGLDAMDVQEFLRFFMTGVIATIGNIGTVWLIGYVLPYRWALLAGLASGFTISFAMGKFFAFRSRSLRRAPGEIARFTLVYAFGAGIYWIVAMVLGLLVLPHILPQREAGLLGALVGASVMVVTSYLGHRFYTYRHRGDPTP